MDEEKEKRIKVLVSAYACEPGKGSEPAVGWNWVKAISQVADEVWVITRANNRIPIENGLKNNPLPNVHWIYFDLPKVLRFWKRGQFGVHLYYILWQIGIYFLLRKVYREIKFDLVHHVTFGNYWMPSFLSLFPMPFIWGPVGGGETTPWSFYRDFSLRGQLYEIIRDLVRWLGELNPFVKLTAIKSAFVLVKAKETADRVSLMGARRVFQISEVILSDSEIKWLFSCPFKTDGPFRILSLGRLLHWKGFHLGIKSFAQFAKKIPYSEYWIVGDGPERRNLERLAEQLGVSDRVRFWGKIPREEALRKLFSCDVLIHPSLHDSGGWVCVEAMAAGKPVICLDLGGPAFQVDKNVGFKIPPTSPEDVVKKITEAMCYLNSNPSLRQEMGRSARLKVQELFSLESRKIQIRKFYSEINYALEFSG